uniref:TIR domain-containing protein n=2 Tax=Macrostomum lignano TaxID=282301 RepID=A0A1I8GWW7_9PLAT
MSSVWAPAVVIAATLLLAGRAHCKHPFEALLSAECSETEPAWSELTLQLPLENNLLADISGGKISSHSVLEYNFRQTQVLSFRCAQVPGQSRQLLTAKFRKERAAAMVDHLDFFAHFDLERSAAMEVGEGAGLSMWLYFSFEGWGSCSHCNPSDHLNECRRQPAVLIVAKKPRGSRWPTRWQLLVENTGIGGLRDFRLELKFAGQAAPTVIDRTQFSEAPSSRWWQLRNLTGFADKMRSDLLQAVYQVPKHSRSIFERNKLQESKLDGVNWTSCPWTNVEAGSKAGTIEQQHAWLIGGLSSLLAVMLLIGFAVFKQHRIAALLASCRQSRPLRVAVVGCNLRGAGLRRRQRSDWWRRFQRQLSQESARGPVNPAADFEVFDSADIAELRERSTDFDLVLLCLEQPGQQLSEAQLQLAEAERWRFRVLLLATDSGSRAGKNGIETAPMMGSLTELPNPVRPGVKVGGCGGIDCGFPNEAEVERLFQLARQAYQRALRDC